MASTAPDDRKRPHNHVSDTEDRPRKRLQSGIGADEEEEEREEEEEENLWPNYKDLEAYRKEAIYRKLLESRRRLTRTNENLRSAQSDLDRSEHSVALFRRFWSLLVEDISSFTSAEQRSKLLTPPDLEPSTEALQRYLQEQVAVITSVFSSVADGQTSREAEQLQQRCHDLADEAATSKHDLFLVQSKLDRTERSLRERSSKLSRVEKEFVRSQSEVVRVTEGRKSPSTAEASRTAPNLDADTEKGPTNSRASPTQADGKAVAELQDQLLKSQEDLAIAEKQGDSRYAEIQELNEEIKGLKLALHQLKSQVNGVADEQIESSPLCKELRVKLTRNEEELKGVQGRLVSLEAENTELREELASLVKASEIDTNERIEALEKTIKNRDSDVTRIRRQRDDLSAELSERRQREQVKFTQIEEMKALVNTKEERLAILTSQVRRQKLTIAASRGETAAVDALLEGGTETDQFDRVATAAKLAEAEVDQLRRKLADLGHPDANGTGLTAPSSTDKIEEEVRKLRLELRAAEASSAALCDEIDRLSIAYSELEKQASNYVMDISKMENKTLRLVTEKSKADQKFFSTMRVKESLENENRHAMRNVERQSKLIELLTEGEKSFVGQLQQHEKEVSLFKRAMDEHVKKIASLETELEASKARIDDANRSKAKSQESAKELIDAATDEKNARKRAEEKVMRLEKDLLSSQRQLARSAALNEGKSGRKISDEDESAATQMLQCSTCKESWRSVLISKCYHTFCKSCIDSRIQTRQRKCPHCAIPFATGDVQPLYLQ